MGERLKFSKIEHYNPKVLIGPWVEDRSCYTKNRYNHKSTYNRDFRRKSHTNSFNVLFDNKIKSNGLNPEVLLHNSGHNYLDNLTSTYDLSYKYFPKKYSNKFRKPDMLRNFGNMTNFGLLNHKKQIWELDQLDPRYTTESEYKDVFSKPKAKDYDLRRYTIDSFKYNKKCNPLTWECKCPPDKGTPIRCLPNDKITI